MERVERQEDEEGTRDNMGLMAWTLGMRDRKRHVALGFIFGFVVIINSLHPYLAACSQKQQEIPFLQAAYSKRFAVSGLSIPSGAASQRVKGGGGQGASIACGA